MLVITQQTGKEKFLSLRKFNDEDTRTAYEQQQDICPICGQHFDFEKYTPTISRPDTLAVRLFQKTCRCFAEIVI